LASKFGADDYAYSLANAGAVAAQTGFTFEEFNAAVAATAFAFSSGRDAGTSLKVFFQRLTPVGEAAASAMAELGVDAFDAQGNLLSLGAVAEQLRAGIAKLSQEDGARALREAFGSDAVRTAAALAGFTADEMDRLGASIRNASATEQAQARMEGYNGMLKRVASAWEALSISMGESGVTEVLTRFGNGIADALAWLSKIDPRLLKFGTIFVGLAVVVTPIVTAIALFAAAVTAIGAPVAAAIAAVVALTAAAVAFWPEITAAADAIGDALSTALDYTVKMTKAIARQFFDNLAAPFRWVKENVMEIGDFFFELYDRVVGNSYVPDMVDEIGAEFRRLDGEMVRPAEAATSEVAGLFDTMGQAVAGSLSDMAESGSFSFGSLVDGLRTAGGRAIGAGIDSLVGLGVDSASGALSSAFSTALASPLAPGASPLPVGGSLTGGTAPPLPTSGGGRAGVVVNIQTPDPQAFNASRAQVSGAVARAVGRAQRTG
ncbi:MAG: phage tail tape measure protein, partial [Pseudomonadota bacterium]